MEITIRDSVVNIYCNEDKVSKAKDKLLTKMYYARNKQTLGGYEGWQKLLDMYYAGKYKEMAKYIKSCKGAGGKTRKECIDCLNTIMGK